MLLLGAHLGFTTGGGLPITVMPTTWAAHVNPFNIPRSDAMNVNGDRVALGEVMNKGGIYVKMLHALATTATVAGTVKNIVELEAEFEFLNRWDGILFDVVSPSELYADLVQLRHNADAWTRAYGGV